MTRKLTLQRLWATLNAVDPTVQSRQCTTVEEVAAHFNHLVALGLGKCEVESRDTEGELCDGIVIRKLNDENTVQVVGERR